MSNLANKQIQRLLEDINGEIGELARPVLAEIAPMLWEAQLELEAGLQRLLAQVDGEDTFTAQQLRRALIQVRAAQEKIAEIEPVLVESFKGAASDASMLAARHLQRQLEVFSLRFGDVSPIPLIPAARIASGEKLLIKRFKSSARRYSDSVQKDIRKQLAVGLVKGENFFQLANRLMKSGGPDGIFKKYRYWANRLVRTEVVHAYDSLALRGIQELHKEDSRIMKRWDATVDGRICALCREMDHVVVDVDKSFPGGFDHPPLHPNCRCAVVAWRSDWSESGPVKKL